MKEKAVSATFNALFALTDLRQIFRETKPTHKLDHERRERVRIIIDEVRRSLRTIEEELLSE